MTQALAALAERFEFNRKTLQTVVEVLDREDWSAKPGEEGNSAHWILGHVAGTRRYLLRHLGEGLVEEPWEAFFGNGAEPSGDEGYPSPEDLLEDIHQSGELMTVRLTQLTDSDAAADWGSAFPDGSSTVGGGTHFLYFHEIYHLGQLGLLRRIVGKPRFA